MSPISSTLSLLMRLSQGANAALPSKALEYEKPQKRHFGNGLVVVVVVGLVVGLGVGPLRSEFIGEL